jgi:hypothetical protein
MWCISLKMGISSLLQHLVTSGKSTLANKILKEIKNRNKEKKIYLISPFKEDASIDADIKEHIKRLAPDNYKRELFSNSVVVFDDIDSLENAAAIRATYELLKKLLQSARHDGTDIIFINHTLRNNLKTKYVIQECNFFFFFPGSGNDAQITSFIKAYIGFSKQAIREILDTTDSRWIMVHAASPCYVMTQHRIYFTK